MGEIQGGHTFGGHNLGNTPMEIKLCLSKLHLGKLEAERVGEFGIQGMQRKPWNWAVVDGPNSHSARLAGLQRSFQHPWFGNKSGLQDLEGGFEPYCTNPTGSRAIMLDNKGIKK
uniref:Uncharacterized protein n=1 Tax=Coccidioides posadasii RMSCC 3488 TaxID=454284 RepID=A0A0J6EWG2_COCPO|nr:hypothetical protein CPAG_01248 [Coccidioides posadasii RMSCC 3488]